MTSNSIHVTQYIKAPRAKVYAALIDADAIKQWKVPDGMTMRIHEFDGREQGTFRISLTYDTISGTGKTEGRTDTYHGCFMKLIPNEKVIEEDEFETSDPALQGKMHSTITLADKGEGTELTAVHEDLPPGLSLEDNKLGWEISLRKLAKLLEG